VQQKPVTRVRQKPATRVQQKPAIRVLQLHAILVTHAPPRKRKLTSNKQGSNATIRHTYVGNHNWRVATNLS
jgi:Icc-related predicted phosphoesterase